MQRTISAAGKVADPKVTTVELSAGPIDYVDTGGDGPTIVLLHGVLMNDTVWRGVIAELGPAFRCVAPTHPLGAHRHPMRAKANLSIDSIALLVAEFLERLDLGDVTLTMNDWGGPQLLAYHIAPNASVDSCSSPAKPSTTSHPECLGIGSPSSPQRPAGSGCKAC